MKNFLSKNKKILIICFSLIILSFLKQILVQGFPILPLTSAGEDDGLMVKWAYSILDGNWLGEYTYNTLMKGPVFSLILVLLYKLNIKYLTFITIFYTVSCLLLILAIKDLFRNKYYLILIYGIILFNPIMYSSEVFQRVYRNSLIPSFALIIPACYFGMYLNRNKSNIKFILWSLLGSINLSLFYYTREDSMWIMPFIFFISLVIIITLIKKFKLTNIIKIIFTVIPIISLTCFGEWIAEKNYEYYGLKTKNVLSDSYFTDALHAIYAVRPNKIVDCVTVTQEKIARMSTVSPSFNKLYPQISETIGGFGFLDRVPHDGECEDGWVIWAIRQTAVTLGYTSLEQEQELYRNISIELNQAMDDGLLERQFTLPSPLLSPPRKSYILKTMKSFIEGTIYISTFKDISITNNEIVEKTVDVRDAVGKFETITNERALYYLNQSADNIEQNNYINSLQTKTNILNGLTKIYSVIGVILFVSGAVSYIILTVMLIKNKRKRNYYFEKWIVCSGILGALFTLLAGVSYNDAATAYSIRVLYLCGTYPLLLAASIILICLCIEIRNIKTEENKEE